LKKNVVKAKYAYAKMQRKHSIEDACTIIFIDFDLLLNPFYRQWFRVRRLMI